MLFAAFWTFDIAILIHRLQKSSCTLSSSVLLQFCQGEDIALPSNEAAETEPQLEWLAAAVATQPAQVRFLESPVSLTGTCSQNKIAWCRVVPRRDCDILLEQMLEMY
jgi:hypothetical protein